MFTQSFNLNLFGLSRFKRRLFIPQDINGSLILYIDNINNNNYFNNLILFILKFLLFSSNLKIKQTDEFIKLFRFYALNIPKDIR
jgi:hypothetical protein